jgi:hypothetical protein
MQRRIPEEMLGPQTLAHPHFLSAIKHLKQQHPMEKMK